MPEGTQGKVALVTGGTGALGSAVVTAMTEAGITIFRESQYDPDSRSMRFDVTDPIAVNGAIQSAIEIHGHHAPPGLRCYVD